MPGDRLPKNWPPTVPYLKSPLHSRDLTKEQVNFLAVKPIVPSPTSTSNPGATSIPILTASQTSLPCPLVKITAISTPSHPAKGQLGLFATATLKPGTFILPYLGRVHSSASTDPGSDYDIWLDRGVDVAVDASAQGNEARFVNDFRGVRERPNAEFAEGWSELWQERVVGVWVVKDGRDKKGKGIQKGEEIVILRKTPDEREFMNDQKGWQMGTNLGEV